MTQQEKGAAFRALHEGETFVIPNPWDAGSARVLAALGFQALATTSSGFAFTLGRLDGGVDAGRGRRARRRARPRRPTCPSRSTSRTATARLRTTRRGRSRGPPRRARSAARSRTTTRTAALYPLEARGRAGRGRRRGRAGARLPVHAHRAGREPHPRQPRPRRHDRAAAGLRARPARTCSTRPGLSSVEEIRAVCAAVTEARQRARPAGADAVTEIAAAGAAPDQRRRRAGLGRGRGVRRRRPSGSATTATSAGSDRPLGYASGSRSAPLRAASASSVDFFGLRPGNSTLGARGGMMPRSWTTACATASQRSRPSTPR